MHNQRQQTTGLWTSPAVRVARLGGLCVVAGAGLLVAGGIATRAPSSAEAWGVAALVLLPALALGALALHRSNRAAH
ncbi:MAG: hypothetical protein ACIAQU_03540 [Phycisphaerales bacterium JB064]